MTTTKSSMNLSPHDCKHIIGFVLCSYPQEGESNRLAYSEEDFEYGAGEERFNYCPMCGIDLRIKESK